MGSRSRPDPVPADLRPMLQRITTPGGGRKLRGGDLPDRASRLILHRPHNKPQTAPPPATGHFGILTPAPEASATWLPPDLAVGVDEVAGPEAG